jgi:hypothetical protein
MPALTSDQILSASDLTNTKVDVPEWGEGAYVHLRVLTAKERDNFESWCSKCRKREDFTGIRAKLLSLTLCDEHSKRLFTDAQMDALGAKSGIILDRLFDAAREVNAMTDEAVKELAKNSESGQSDDST